jgi:hypothetical protein
MTLPLVQLPFCSKSGLDWSIARIDAVDSGIDQRSIGATRLRSGKTLASKLARRHSGLRLEGSIEGRERLGAVIAIAWANR